MDISSRQKISKKTLALNDSLNQINHIYIYIYITFPLKAAKYTFFTSAYETFSRIDCMLGHKISLGKFKKIEVISSAFLSTKP